MLNSKASNNASKNWGKAQLQLRVGPLRKFSRPLAVSEPGEGGIDRDQPPTRHCRAGAKVACEIPC
jgi:hypothetical protein